MKHKTEKKTKQAKPAESARKLQGIWKDLPKSVVKELLKKTY
jgi:hypothetical protein